MVNQEIKQKILKSFRNAYINSPLNFSTITGLKYPGIPRLKGNFLLGRLPALFKENGALENIIEAGKLAETHPSGMCYFWLGAQVAILLTDPEDIQALKVKYETHLSRDLPLLRKAVGVSIFTDNRETWQQKRDVIKKIINHETVETLEPQIRGIVTAYINTLKNYENRSIDLRTFLSNMVLDVVTINLMGCPAKSLHSNDKQIQIDQFNELSHFLLETLQEVLQLHNIFKYMLPTFIQKIFFGTADNFETVKNKMQNHYYNLFLSPYKTSILATTNLIKEVWDINHTVSGQTCKEYNNKDIFGDGLFLLIAGIATTVITLEFVVKLLAAHPEKMEKLRTEIQQHIQNKEITFEAINRMTYLEMVIKETLRLYPPAPLLMPRELDSSIEIKGLPLSKGVVPIFSPYVTHRLKKYWDKPEEFIPERFAKENQSNINLRAYFPFSTGPRFCAGQQFAMLEMKIALVELYRQYNISVENNSFAVTLKQGGMSAAIAPMVKLERITQN